MVASVNVIETVVTEPGNFSLSTENSVCPAGDSGPCVLFVLDIHFVCRWKTNIALFKQGKKSLLKKFLISELLNGDHFLIMNLFLGICFLFLQKLLVLLVFYL